MRSKFNTQFSQGANRTEQHGSYLQNYLKDEIDALLAFSANQITQVDFDDLYIHNPGAESQLQAYAHHTYTNNTCVVEGLTGAGKTMLVRHVFGIHSWRAKISDRSLIIPFTFDNMHDIANGNSVEELVDQLFANMVHAACDCMREAIPNLKGIDDYEEEFYNSIKEHRQDLLYCIDDYPSPSRREQLRALLRAHPLAFHSSALKFYLSQSDISFVDNVIIVVDDIEGLVGKGKENRQCELLPVKAALELIECLQNKGKGAISWSLNTVICCRHYVSRMMRTLPYSRSMMHAAEGIVNYMQALQAYAPCERIDLSESPSLIDIISKRYNALCKKGNVGMEKWEVAMDVVMELLKKADDHIANFIINLTLQNNREAMKLLKQVVLNKRWVQREFPMSFQETFGAFKIQDIAQFRVTPVALIRALGMNESDVYHSNESAIPNILYNEQNPDMDLFPLLTLKFFVQMAGNEPIAIQKMIANRRK